MRILYATDSYYPKIDGVVRYIDETSKLLSKNHEVGILAPSFGKSPGTEFENGIEINRQKSINLSIHGYGFAFPYYAEAKKVVLRYDVVFVQSIAPLGSIALLAARHNHRPLLAFVHCLESVSMEAAFRQLFSPFKRAMDFYSQRMYMRCDRLLLESRTVAMELERLGLKNYDRMLFGIDHNRFRRGMKSKFDFGLPDDKPVVLFAGRISYQKGVDILVQIIRNLSDDVHFLVVGDGPQRSMIEELNVPNMTYVGGFLNNIEDAFASSDVFLFIGNEFRRDLTMICYEALASGLPIVAPDFAYDTVLKEGYNSVLCERTGSSLTKGILKAVEEPLHTQMSINAAESVKDLTWPRYVERLERVIMETVESFKHRRDTK